MRGEFSALRWACATIAPWCLASGLLMSFTASADIEASAGGSRAVREADHPRPSYFVAGPGTADLALLTTPEIAVNRLRAPWLTPPSDTALNDAPRGDAPRMELKRDVQGFPSVERAMKGDPLIQLRTGRWQGSGRERELAAATFGKLDPSLADERLSFEPGDPWTNQLVGSKSFIGWSVEDGATARAPRGAFTSASDIVSATTRAKLTASNPDGATPAVARAVRLSPTTPVPPIRRLSRSPPCRSPSRARLAELRASSPRTRGSRRRARKRAKSRITPSSSPPIIWAARSVASRKPCISSAERAGGGQAAVAQVVSIGSEGLYQHRSAASSSKIATATSGANSPSPVRANRCVSPSPMPGHAPRRSQ